jgi:hypothetical protein
MRALWQHTCRKFFSRSRVRALSGMVVKGPTPSLFTRQETWQCIVVVVVVVVVIIFQHRPASGLQEWASHAQHLKAHKQQMTCRLPATQFTHHMQHIACWHTS